MGSEWALVGSGAIWWDLVSLVDRDEGASLLPRLHGGLLQFVLPAEDSREDDHLAVFIARGLTQHVKTRWRHEAAAQETAAAGEHRLPLSKTLVASKVDRAVSGRAREAKPLACVGDWQQGHGALRCVGSRGYWLSALVNPSHRMQRM